MAQINPPSFAHLPRSSHKRKRLSSFSSSQNIPSGSISFGRADGVINPLSYTPATLRQLRVAGHSDTDLLPSESVPQFPHRPLPDPRTRPTSRRDRKHRAALTSLGASSNSGGEGDESDGAEEEGGDGDQATDEVGKAARRRRGVEQAHRVAERHLGVLNALAHRSLEGGDIATAKRAFGLLIRSEVWGKPVDIRQSGYWALGAEILMREGEEAREKNENALRREPAEMEEDEEEEEGEGEGSDEGDSHKQQPNYRRWGRAENMAKVRDYFMALIYRYPYNKFQPRAISALDFWPALLGTELYNTHVEHKLALRRLEAESESRSVDGSDAAPDHEEDRMDYEGGSNGSSSSSSPTAAVNTTAGRQKAARQHAATDHLRLEALRQMRDVARSMDGLMGTGPPYVASHELLRLRGMIALYMADLVVPPRRPDSPTTSGLGGGKAADDEAKKQREAERERARQKFRRIMEDGGEVDEWIREFVRPRRRRIKAEEVDDDMDGEEYSEDDDEDDDQSVADLPVFSSLPIRGR